MAFLLTSSVRHSSRPTPTDCTHSAAFGGTAHTVQLLVAVVFNLARHLYNAQPLKLSELSDY